MKKILAALVLTAACAAPAMAGDVGLSLSIGEPGFYGQIDIGNYGRPRVVYEQPMIVEHRYRDLAPVYLRVPPGHQKNWRRYCEQYNACTRPVYFVRDDWYRNEYSPRYRQDHGRGNERRDDRYDDHGDRGHSDNGNQGNHGNQGKHGENDHERH